MHEEANIATQLGVDWRLLLSQMVNFGVVLILLRAFVYRPVLKVLAKRREKIEEGMAKAQEADTRLKEVDNISLKKIKEAESRAVNILEETGAKAKKMEAEMARRAKEREVEEAKKLEANLLRRQEEARRETESEIVGLVKSALVKTVELSPEKVDEKLIREAIKNL